MRKRATRFFTLLEITIVIAILGICSTLGINIYRSIETNRLQTGLKELCFQVKYYQNLALLRKVDITFSLSQTEKGSHFSFLSHEEKNLTYSHHHPKEIPHLFFTWNEEPIEKLTLHFSSTGKVSPSGELSFLDAKKKELYHLELPLSFYKESHLSIGEN